MQNVYNKMNKLIKYHFDKIVTKAYNEATQYQLINGKELIEYEYSILYENVNAYFYNDRGNLILLADFPWAHIHPTFSFSKYFCCLGEETRNTLRTVYQRSPDALEQVVHDYFLTMSIKHVSYMGLPKGQTHQNDIKLCAFSGKPYHISLMIEIGNGEFIHKRHDKIKDNFKLHKKCSYCGAISMSYKLNCFNCGNKRFTRYRAYC